MCCVLCCAVLSGAELCCAVLCDVLCSAVLCCAVLHDDGIVLCCVVLCCVVCWSMPTLCNHASSRRKIEHQPAASHEHADDVHLEHPC